MFIDQELLAGVSPYLSQINYDATARLLKLVVVDSMDSCQDIRYIIFPDITSFSDEIDDFDSNTIEGIIGIHWMNKSQICIKTDMREIVISTQGKPYFEDLPHKA